MTQSLLDSDFADQAQAGGPARPGGANGSFGAAMMPFLLDGLRNLSAEEMKRLDAAITPDAAYLLTKAFGPEMGALLWPLIVNDEDAPEEAGPDGS